MANVYLSSLLHSNAMEANFIAKITRAALPFAKYIDGYERSSSGSNGLWMSGEIVLKIIWQNSLTERHYSVNLSEFPGQCSILVAHNLPVDSTSNRRAIDVAEMFAKVLEYSTVMISHKVGSIQEMEWGMFGYKFIFSTTNIHSNTKIAVLSKEIDTEDELAAQLRDELILLKPIYVEG